MYKNRKNTRSKFSAPPKRALNAIDENATTKSQRMEDVEIICKKSVHSQNCEKIFNSDDNIPPSQEQTQRYLSQRSVNAVTLYQTQLRSMSQNPPSSYFELILMKAGVQFDETENLVLSCDHVSFIGKLRELLMKSQHYPDNVETFKEGMLDHLKVTSPLMWKMLGGCTIKVSGLERVYQSQDSVIGNFFMVNFLREHVLNVLLNKIEETAFVSDPSILNQRKTVFALLLSQLRYAPLSYCDIIYTRIKHIFEKCSDFAKRDLMANVELFLDSSKHDEFAQVILDNLPKDTFDANTVDALTNLCLSIKMQQKLCNKILGIIANTQSLNVQLPHLISFLLKTVTNETDLCVHEIITVLREILLWQVTVSLEQLDKKQQLEVFSHISHGLMRSRSLCHNWLKTIAVMPEEQFRSVDFVILLALINVKEDYNPNIQNNLRRFIIKDSLNTNTLVEVKSKFCAILVLQTNVLVQIAYDFLCDKEKSVSDFARAMYSTLFEIEDSSRKNILAKLLEITFEKSSSNMANHALKVIIDLNHSYKEKLQNMATLLLPLLDRLNDMSLSQTRLVMGLLCSIAYPVRTIKECPALQDHIDMVVKKQLINSTSIVKKRGIIGGIQLIDNIARIDEASIEIDDLNSTFSAINDLPDGRGKTAAHYIVRLHSSIIHCPEVLALFYDELANVCAPSVRSDAYDKPFLIWLCELMTYNFQNSFVAEHSPETAAGISLSNQKCLNSVEDTNTEDNELPPIAINIAELILEPTSDATASILILAPLFRLVRVLHLQRYNGSLELINALLGCAIILPKFFDDPEELWLDFDVESKRKTLDIYFHCANWIRETISSFATQREDMIRRKVLIRLTDLIKIEEQIRRLLFTAPLDYIAPVCQFINYSCSSSIIRNTRDLGVGYGTRRSTSKQNCKSREVKKDDFVPFKDTDINIITKKPHKFFDVNNYFNNLYGRKEIYWQMDSNIMLILCEKLIVEVPLPNEEIGRGIGLIEYRFILNDLVCKLESLRGMKKCDNGDPIQYISNPVYFMMDLSKFLGDISRNIELLARAIFEKLEDVKHVYGHVDLFSDRLSYLKVNLALSFRLLAAFFSWFDFESDKTTLLKESLLSLLERSAYLEFKNKRSYEIARKLFNSYKQICLNIVDLKTGVHLYHILLAMNKFSFDKDATDARDYSLAQEQSNDIRNFCKSLLMRQWYNYGGCIERGPSCNIHLNALIKGFLKDSDFGRQCEILHAVLDETKLLRNNESGLRTFPNIRKENFSILFRGLCEVLITSVSTLTDKNESTDKLRIWENSCEILNLLLEVLQALELSRNFQIFLKYSHMYLKLVLEHGLAAYEQILRENPERVSGLLRNLQVTTRFLHNLCCHSKALKNTAIVGQVPFLRETVETLVFRVKALLVANKCASVFWMGNLKNKDLHGDELLSQPVSVNSSLPDDDQNISDDMDLDDTLFGNDDSDSLHTFGESFKTNHCKTSSRSKCF